MEFQHLRVEFPGSPPTMSSPLSEARLFLTAMGLESGYLQREVLGASHFSFLFFRDPWASLAWEGVQSYMHAAWPVLSCCSQSAWPGTVTSSFAEMHRPGPSPAGQQLALTDSVWRLLVVVRMVMTPAKFNYCVSEDLSQRQQIREQEHWSIWTEIITGLLKNKQKS